MVGEKLIHIETNLPDTARIWIYAATTNFSRQAAAIEERLKSFKNEWFCHGAALINDAFTLHDQFIVLVVDEQQTPASGCSIDQSVNFIKALEHEFNLSLFDRMTFHYLADEKVHSVDRNTFQQLFQEGSINEQTLVFDPLVKDVKALKTAFLKPLADSWHKQMV